MPVGEVYSATESANGELRFYLGLPRRQEPLPDPRPPALLPIFNSFDEQVRGRIIADAVSISWAASEASFRRRTRPLACSGQYELLRFSALANE